MGRYCARVGKFYAEYGDYQWDYIKDKQPLEYYQNKTFTITLEDVETDTQEYIEVPVLDVFIEVEKLKKNYTYKHKDGNTLLSWLFEYAKGRGRIFCMPFVQTTWETSHHRRWKEYYLDSGLHEPIILKETTDNVIELEDIEDLFWLQNNGLTKVDWCNEKGEVYEN